MNNIKLISHLEVLNAEYQRNLQKMNKLQDTLKSYEELHIAQKELIAAQSKLIEELKQHVITLNGMYGAIQRLLVISH